MTPTLTDAGKNQLIADKCPGRFKNDVFVNVWSYSHPKFGTSTCLNSSIIDDLNAMAVAESMIRENGHWIEYKEHLDYICFQSGPDIDPVNAPSRQRADAFAKVFGLW